MTEHDQHALRQPDLAYALAAEAKRLRDEYSHGIRRQALRQPEPYYIPRWVAEMVEAAPVGESALIDWARNGLRDGTVRVFSSAEDWNREYLYGGMSPEEWHDFGCGERR